VLGEGVENVCWQRDGPSRAGGLRLDEFERAARATLQGLPDVQL